MSHNVTFYRDGECLIDETIRNTDILKTTIGRGIRMLKDNGTLQVTDLEGNLAINYTMVAGVFYMGRFSADAYVALNRGIQ